MDGMNRREMFGALAAFAALGAAGMDAQAQTAGGVDLSRSQVFRFSEMIEKKSSNGGWSRAVTKGTLPTGEIVEVHETMLPPGQMPHPPHRHPNSEFILIREGSIQHLNEGVADPRPVGPGDIIFNGSNKLHGMKNVGTVNATYFVVSVSKQLS
jgi:quercetin dioxygenase-like cupin family protein